jgi:signal transduction histidine kinase
MPPSFEEYAAERLAAERERLTRAWVERIASDLQDPPRRVLPTEELLAVIPAVLDAAAPFVRTGQSQTLRGNAVIAEPLRALTRLRRSQGYDLRELLCELDLLAQVLDGACLEWLAAYPAETGGDALIRASGRLNRAPILIGEAVVSAYHDADLDAGGTLQEFTDILTHELNTPLGAAEGAALLLESDEIVGGAQERRHFAGLIQRNLRRARMVISDVRELALARAGAQGSQRWLPLALVLDEVLMEIRDEVRAAGTRIEVDGPVPDLLVDAGRAESILLNLIGNAAKYADPTRAVRWVRLSFEARQEGGCWVRVSDNGLGIPPEHQGKIFQRFFRAHPDRAEGTGLGLAIVREAVQQLGGEIEFHSEPGVGSTFRFSLPTGERRAGA